LSWAPQWIEYKNLKKLLHPFVRDEKPAEHPQKEYSDPVAAANTIGIGPAILSLGQRNQFAIQ
jgi:hypothetical protein